MDDFNVSSLHESKNEWASRLVTILTPLITEGYKSILEESIKLCKDNNEMEKYLMTFQNLVSRIPKWNQTIIDTECQRITEKSGCVYLEDLLTCVHIIQLKILTSMRVGQKQKKIDISVPKFNDFIHKTYINVARKLYKNIYLFELYVPPLQAQKNNREIEVIIQECIINTIRENIPIEMVIKAYMDESIEEDVTEEVKEDVIDEVVEEPLQKTIAPVSVSNAGNSVEEKSVSVANEVVADDASSTSSVVQFDDIDYVKDSNNNVSHIEASKTIERLEEIGKIRNQERQQYENEDEDEDDDDHDDKITITNNNVSLGDIDDITNIGKSSSSLDNGSISLKMPSLMNDIEILT
jgi:hypothetical protein